MSNFNIPSELTVIHHPLFEDKKVKVAVKRDDLIHPEISGNKWRKLNLNVEKFKQGNYDAILSFGGAFSNHIAALASLSKEMNIPTIGIIRGDELNETSNDTLKKAKANGMELVFVSREKYQYRYEKWYWADLRNEFGNVLIIEEGGANYLGVLGCARIMNEFEKQPDYVIAPMGTGTTVAGLTFQADQTKVIGVPAFKNSESLLEEIKQLLMYCGLSEEDIAEKINALHIENRFHFGRYGKVTPELIDFVNEFYQVTQLKLDLIYTGKMMYTFFKLLNEDFFPIGSEIILIHTGGMQGNQAFSSSLHF
ncbi:1-aminocyclopropane-1-carboxylate deaminase/D-cysteine desulfhydrase [Putridiphycobacter roseus]|uniref:1-aminocyclopropane-1-carboxylate deaminase/D-cysteine desulfhydrase n=1 Tax=Putridiphycobacter roseus TaxID=2219161 RepID=A0A2W1MYJ1_9FLAO|nr:pyridoxal-phosphate dependent enzyme [Putridiphycobacter roseus]PZE17249.1 1-aminocyclopropane-1-carboxylate deaminase/D-cysteine desulfhydrase [Putridiphycobacter roseus]